MNTRKHETAENTRNRENEELENKSKNESTSCTPQGVRGSRGSKFENRTSKKPAAQARTRIDSPAELATS